VSGIEVGFGGAWVMSLPNFYFIPDKNYDGVPDGEPVVLLDIVTGKRFWAHGPKGDAEPNAPAVLYWFELTRKGKTIEYIPHQIDDNSGVGTQVAAGDVNGDGTLDIVVGNKKGAFVHLHTIKKVSQKEWQAAQPKRLK